MKPVDYLALIIAVVVVNNIISFTPGLGFPYYVVMLAALLISLMLGSKTRVSLLMTGLYVVGPEESVFSQADTKPQYYFQPYCRVDPAIQQ